MLPCSVLVAPNPGLISTSPFPSLPFLTCVHPCPSVACPERPSRRVHPERLPPYGGSLRDVSTSLSALPKLAPFLCSPRKSYTRKDFKSFRFSTYEQFLMMLKTNDFKPFRISRSMIFARNPFGFSRYIKTWGGRGGIPAIFAPSIFEHQPAFAGRFPAPAQGTIVEAPEPWTQANDARTPHRDRY
jgi:hypothetical protein